MGLRWTRRRLRRTRRCGAQCVRSWRRSVTSGPFRGAHVMSVTRWMERRCWSSPRSRPRWTRRGGTWRPRGAVSSRASIRAEFAEVLTHLVHSDAVDARAAAIRADLADRLAADLARPEGERRLWVALDFQARTAWAVQQAGSHPARGVMPHAE